MDESAVSADLTTSPRLTAFPATRLGTEYQLISARVAPASLTPIHVPRFGSEGQSMVRPPSSSRGGGGAAPRGCFWARFRRGACRLGRGKKGMGHLGVSGPTDTWRPGRGFRPPPPREPPVSSGASHYEAAVAV